MIDDSIREFLQKPLLARMTTIDEEGYPHSVPVWFMLDGDDLIVSAWRSTRKVNHVTANPKGAITIGGDTDDGGGYLFKGDFTIVDDPDHGWINKMTYRYEEKEKAEKDIAEWADLDMIILRMKPRKVLKV